MTYEQFMATVNSKMSRHFGFSSSDVEDYDWFNYYEDDLDLDDATSEAVAMWAYDHGFDGNPATYSETRK